MRKKLDHLTRTFGCDKGSLPFTYLGLPLGITKPKLDDFLPMINRCEKRLASVSAYLSQAGRLGLTNPVFSSLPTIYMCTLTLPPTVIKQIDNFRKHCLWRGSEANNRKTTRSCLGNGHATQKRGRIGSFGFKKAK